MKYVVLDLLQEGPRHGYDIIRALEERFHGLYSPSPGSVYPTLQLLEDQGFVKSAEQDGKRVYTITDEGRAFLTSRRDTMEDVRAKMAGWAQRAPADIHALADEVRQLGQMLFRQAAHGALRDPETIQQLREAVARARADIEAIFARGPEPPENVV